VVFAEIAVVLAVPMMIVLVAASVAVPVAIVITLAIVARRYPASSQVMRASIVSVMPSVTAPYRIPITVHPDKIGTRAHGPNANVSRTWWRANPDPQG
jgi:hypothetical protein